VQSNEFIKYDCASCGNRRCALKEDFSLDEVMAEWNSDPDKAKVPMWTALEAMNVCPFPFVTPLSKELLKLYYALDNPRSIEDYYNQPGILVHGRQIINAELARIAKYKKDT